VVGNSNSEAAVTENEFEVSKNKFMKFYSDNSKRFDLALKKTEELVRDLLIGDLFIHRVSSRLKDQSECIAKFEKKYRQSDDVEASANIEDWISDLLGVRIVCLYSDEIEPIRKVIEENFERIGETNKIRKIEVTEDKFGYKALHLDVAYTEERLKLPEYSSCHSLEFEMQIRTVSQDAWSVLDHKIKYKKNIPDDLKRRVSRMAALFDLADDEFLAIKNRTLEMERDSKVLVDEATVAIKQKRPLEKETSVPLNSTALTQILSGFAPNFNFWPTKIDAFASELQKKSANLTIGDFLEMTSKNWEFIDKYSEWLRKNKTFEDKLSPFTHCRHVLYFADKITFRDLLFESQRKAFDEWLKTHNGK
jgi:putative GTP pyrophosphokinase